MSNFLLLWYNLHYVSICRPGYFGFYEISYMWYSAFAVIVCHVVGIPVSLLTGEFLHFKCVALGFKGEL